MNDPLALVRSLQQQRRFAEAYDVCLAAAEADPGFVEAHANLGNLARLLAREGDAIRHFETALRIDPGFAEVQNSLAIVYHSVGRLDDAIAGFRRALELQPGEHRFESNLLYAQLFAHAGDPQRVYELHKHWARRCATPLLNRFKFANDKDPNRRLRVGLVSPHFKQHAVNFFVERILEMHDRQSFELFCYSDTDRNDATTPRLRQHAATWRDVRGIADEQLAATIFADGIDILVDLCGHLAGNRLLVFARKPAPVQITYIGYQSTTGLPNMDWRMTDAWCDPPGQTEAWHTEKLLRLDPVFFCYRPSPDAPDVATLPALRNGFLTFGCLNNFAKVSAQTIDAWTALMQQVPSSRLVLLCRNDDDSCAKLLTQFADRSVDSSRLQLVGWSSRRDYLERHNGIDIALDPIPFNGHTTTCDALWMGVPVVSLSGTSYVSRYGGVALRAVGLEKLVTSHAADYVRAAGALAQAPDELAALRRGLRERMIKSPILDSHGFARSLSAALRHAWKCWIDETSA